VRTLFVVIVMFLLVFFWSIPVLFAASLANLTAISLLPGYSLTVVSSR
jgi:hypothetical protein